MKKITLFLLCGALLGVASCKNSSDEQLNQQSLKTKAAFSGTTVDETLNGINEGTAIALIEQFEKDIYKNKGRKLPQLNFWFGLDVIKKMFAVIRDDKLDGRVTDGIRIYFTGDIAGRSNNILLVTTISDGNKGHIDFYTHRNNALFSDIKRYGSVFDQINRHGATLYPGILPIPGGGENCELRRSVHSIATQEAQGMVKLFADAMATDTASINTKSVWFPVSVFEDIVKDKECDGMRIYFARGTTNNTDNHRWNRDTFVITSTKKGNYPEDHDDFYYCDKIVVKSKDTEPQDNGSLCPVLCN